MSGDPPVVSEEPKEVGEGVQATQSEKDEATRTASKDRRVVSQTGKSSDVPAVTGASKNSHVPRQVEPSDGAVKAGDGRKEHDGDDDLVVVHEVLAKDREGHSGAGGVKFGPVEDPRKWKSDTGTKKGEKQKSFIETVYLLDDDESPVSAPTPAQSTGDDEGVAWPAGKKGRVELFRWSIVST